MRERCVRCPASNRSPQAAKQITEDAFLNGLFYDGVDLRHFRRWGRHAPPEIRIALELDKPPDFDGVKRRLRRAVQIEVDHIEPAPREVPPR